MLSADASHGICTSLIEWPCPSLAPALPESFLCVYLCETDDAPATVDEAKDEDEEEDEDEDGEFALPAMDGHSLSPLVNCVLASPSNPGPARVGPCFLLSPLGRSLGAGACCAGPRKIQFLARGDRWRHWAAKRAAAVGP
eukprot:1972243-Rhodomonas_salina.4